MQFFAQPYNIDASRHGFYFDSADEYAEKVEAASKAFGRPIEEFEIQIIDGDDLEIAVAKAMGVNQCNIAQFYELMDDYDEHELLAYAIAVGEGGYDNSVDPSDLDVSVYEGMSMKELAEQFVEEGIFGDIPDSIANYIDYDAIARDLRFDYSEAHIAGKDIIYRLD